MAENREKFIFISYSHKDSDFVIPVIGELKRCGFNVWYDSGIEAGSEWTEFIAEKIEESAVVLVMLSKSALESHNCRREINFAIEEKKEMLVSYIEDVKLSAGMRMQLNVLHALHFSNFNSKEEFMDSLVNSRILAPCKVFEEKKEPPKAEPVHIENRNEQTVQEDSYEAVQQYALKTDINHSENSQEIPEKFKEPEKNEEKVEKSAQSVEITKATESEILQKMTGEVKENTNNQAKPEKPEQMVEGKKNSAQEQEYIETGISAAPRIPKTFQKEEFIKRMQQFQSVEKEKPAQDCFDIRKVLKEYNSTAKYSVKFKNSLKERQIKNALKYVVAEHGVTEGQIVAFYDETVNDTGKEGFLFTETAMYFRYTYYTLADKVCSVDYSEIRSIANIDECTVFYMNNGKILGIKKDDLFDVYKFAEILLKHRKIKILDFDSLAGTGDKINRAIVRANKVKSGQYFKKDWTFLFEENLCDKQKKNAAKHIANGRIRPEQVVALLDNTKKNSGEEGLLITENGLYDSYTGKGVVEFEKMRSVSKVEGTKEIRITYAGNRTETRDYSPYSDMIYELLTYILKEKKTNKCPYLPLEPSIDSQIKNAGIISENVPYFANAIEKYNAYYPKKISTDFFGKSDAVKAVSPGYGIRMSEITGFWGEDPKTAKYLFTKHALYWRDGDEVGAFGFYGIQGMKVVEGSHISIAFFDGTITGVKICQGFKLLNFIPMVTDEMPKTVWNNQKLLRTSAAMAARLANRDIYKDFYIPNNVEMFRFKGNIPHSKKEVFASVIEQNWVLENLVAYSDTSDGRGETGCWITEKGMYCIASGKHHSIMYDEIDSVSINGFELNIAYKNGKENELVCSRNAELVYRFLTNLINSRANKQA